MQDRQAHWQGVYSSKSEQQVSWFQERPEPSVALMELVGARPTDAIIDIGGGASRLVDFLVAAGHTDLSVLDLSPEALNVAKARLGQHSEHVKWIVADAVDWSPPQNYDIWHDRAAFHFLTEPRQQQAYIERMSSALAPGGRVIFGTFAPDGPEKCSGLPIVRHDAASLIALLGDNFKLVDTRRHDHVTPWDSVQKFQFSTFRRL
ncbi:class I SAM-dependent methyltransferase [Devosia faecipullorum]|uniref:class I SAM-dependent methyltransferase n=1 Tax=Devosia faecipullorum TaxID=2755039 RepID=UPI00187B9A8E|nr:class I SAM-dependent methyltransferase [Devosia faecipullorum]MBE7734179.1 class I SAM-dependent methyltransferase [Devosia faecipullorum]